MSKTSPLRSSIILIFIGICPVAKAGCPDDLKREIEVQIRTRDAKLQEANTYRDRSQLAAAELRKIEAPTRQREYRIEALEVLKATHKLALSLLSTLLDSLQLSRELNAIINSVRKQAISKKGISIANALRSSAVRRGVSKNLRPQLLQLANAVEYLEQESEDGARIIQTSFQETVYKNRDLLEQIFDRINNMTQRLQSSISDLEQEQIAERDAAVAIAPKIAGLPMGLFVHEPHQLKVVKLRVHLNREMADVQERIAAEASAKLDELQIQFKACEKQ